MVEGEFSRIFIGLTERLDMFFHKKIREAKIRDNIEEHKKELMQNTALAVLEKLRDNHYGDYNLTALIWMKARDSWYHYITQFEKSPIRSVSPDDFNQLYIELDSFAALESADYLQHLQQMGKKSSWDMLTMHVHGYEYSLIAERFEISTSAVKMKISRLKNKLGPDKP